MESYLDIRVLSDPEFSDEMLMAALVAKLHRVLGARDKGDIGISFPHVKLTLGDCLRLHGTATALEELEAKGWRKGLNDYVACQTIAPVPQHVRWRTVSRVQPKGSEERLLRRSVRKGWLTQQEADRRLSIAVDHQTLTLPFLNMKSLSNNNPFRLFIQHGDLVDQPVAGTFSSYGLSPVATIPWF
ncbi:type I-F CRISPR-associated endoribonuclease Cas6/Csy4 [Scandinavium goeteborgense]|uniref:CRISPR-associated Csy4 family protein n=1 Tax=Scandinavium goeteborgense TaxID=1851514 RepID=A0A4R6F0A2_SCAGO|nr:type I-F CRISPR-associated endoribonuclease Cas6/Csy4 [Scandinavium goeteborgense]TDN64697.1 CRISPR-associated Csy4 family protein [Scandinavium goeteborgense]